MVPCFSTPNMVFSSLLGCDNMKIYLICGKARSGKGTVSSILKEKLSSTNSVCEIQITRTIKGYIKDYFNWDGNEETKPRKLLQDLGNSIREKDSMFHINRLCEDINNLSDYFDVFLVNDVRFPNEIDEIKKRFSDVISIGVIKEDYVSPLSNDTKDDITEHALDNYDNYDYKIINSDINDLEKDVIDILGGK